jgi:hypothetical protein
MHSAARYVGVFVAVLPSLLIAMALPFILSGKWVKDAQEKARVRRIQDAKMNARLLRFNL